MDIVESPPVDLRRTLGVDAERLMNCPVAVLECRLLLAVVLVVGAGAKGILTREGRVLVVSIVSGDETCGRVLMGEDCMVTFEPASMVSALIRSPAGEDSEDRRLLLYLSFSLSLPFAAMENLKEHAPQNHL